MPSHFKTNHLRCCFTAYTRIFIWGNPLYVSVLFDVILHALPLWLQLYTVEYKCPTKNQCAAIVYCSTETTTENSFCPSTLIILHSCCSLPSCAKSGCIIIWAAEQLVSLNKKKNQWWQMMKEECRHNFFFYCNHSAELTKEFLVLILTYSLIKDLIWSLFLCPLQA